MINFLKNPCNFYIVLLTFYSMQGTIIPTGGTVFSQLILLVAMLMGLYYTIKTIVLVNKPVYFIGLNLLFFMLIVYGVFLLFSNHHYIILHSGADVANFTYLKNLFLSLPNIYIFYYFSRKGYLTEEMLKKWIIVFLGVAVFRFIDFQMTSLLAIHLEGGDVEEVTNNMGYLFVALLPAVVLFKDRIHLQYALLIFCMLFIVLGMKRGAILVGGTSLIYFLYFNYKYNKISKEKVIFFTLLIAVVGFFIVQYMMDTSDFFQSRIIETKEGQSSGRDDMYAHFWSHFTNETDMFKFFFGNGANATLNIGINYAHNDWLELAINQGVLGLVVYAIYWLCFWSTIRSVKHNRTAKLVLTLTFISFFIKTMFSMSYTGYSMMACSVFGYYLAHCSDTEELY